MATHIKNPEAVEQKIFAIRTAGASQLHVVADFDRTLTKAFNDDKKANVLLCQLRHSEYLSDEYAPRATALYDKYHPVEISPDYSCEEKSAIMQEWWAAQLALLIECGMHKKIIDELTAGSPLRFRDNALEFLNLLRGKNIPLLIFSASVGDIVHAYLEHYNCLYDNIHIISNFFNYDDKGFVYDMTPSTRVNPFNKNESLLRGTPYEKIATERNNVILLGDTLGDCHMVDGIQHDIVLGVGFLNERVDENLPSFAEEYDVVITGDGSMDYALEIVNGI